MLFTDIGDLFFAPNTKQLVGMTGLSQPLIP